MDPGAELMLKFIGGDTSSFEQIFKKYKELVINVAYRFLQDRFDAEDVAQEVFLRAYSAKNYKPTAKFSTWIYTITANLCRNRLRSQKRSRTISLHSLPNKIVISGVDNDPSVNFKKQELRRRVKEAIASLPNNQRMAVILQKYESLSYQEISEILGCSVSAVDSLLQRAKQNLKKQLAPHFGK